MHSDASSFFDIHPAGQIVHILLIKYFPDSQPGQSVEPKPVAAGHSLHLLSPL